MIPKHALSLVHAGWKGVDKEIVVKTIQKLGEKYDSTPKDLIVGIGPCIGKDSYIKHNFASSSRGKWGEYISELGHSLFSIDLEGYILEQLLSFGVKRDSIYTSGMNFSEDDRFYSHYRDTQSNEGDQGRFMCVVGMVK